MYWTDVAREAWARRLKQPWTGKSELDKYCSAHFPRTKRSGRRGMVLLHLKGELLDKNQYNSGDFEIVAFPHPDDFKAFQTASRGAFVQTPGVDRPRIGTMRIFYPGTRQYPHTHSDKAAPDEAIHSNAYCLHYVQGNYLLPGNPNLREPELALPIGLHEKYVSWRLHGLREIARMMRRTGKPFVIDANSKEIAHLFKRGNRGRRTSFEVSLQQVVREFHLQRREANGIIYLTPPQVKRRKVKE